MTHTEALKQWADDVSKAYDILAFGHTERAVEILAKTRNAMREALAQPTTGDYALGYAEGFNDACKKPAQPQQEPLEYWNAVEGWVKIEEAREHLDSVGCGTIYKTSGEGRVPLCIAHPQQDPVACEPNDADLLEAFTRSNNGPNPFYRCNICGDTEPGVREYLVAHWLKHNTSPPQRTWQGLTDEEALDCWPGPAMYADCVKFWGNIEAKLKEKND